MTCAECRRAREAPTQRTCTDCGEIKPIAAFIRIRGCINGWYGRCRACRARRSRERYQSDPQERERQKDHVRRTRLRRRMARLDSNPDEEHSATQIQASPV